MIKPLTSDGGMHPNIHDCMDKINELVDTINKMQTMFDAYTKRFRQLDAESKAKIVNGFKNIQDPYAEQRKWVGKLCWFSQIYGCYQHIAILKRISESGLYVTDDGELHYAYCEPVKSDDDIIYKGE